LPKPPSVNSLFATDWKTKRRFISKVYVEWLAAGADVLRETRCKRVPGPISVTITVADRGGVDLANHEKAAVDFLVKHNLIDGDGRKVVREIIMRWSENVAGILLEVSPWA
jgi:Holliday junction resolvase RusA-like endonuclease